MSVPAPAYSLKDISPKAYEHPADRAATAALSQIPMLEQVVKKLLDLGYPRAIRQAALGSAVRINEHQLPRINTSWRMVTQVLDLDEVPDLYLTNNWQSNALTLGYERPYVVLNSGLVTLLDDGALRAVLAHEAGHVLSDHVTYTTALEILLTLVTSRLPMIASMPLLAIRYALLEWYRAAELSCDRAAALVTRDPTAVCRALMCISGGALSGELSLDAFLAQGMDYTESAGLDRLQRLMTDLNLTHPMPVKRVHELMAWVRSGDYDRIVAGSYRKKSDPVDVKAEASSASDHYSERFRGVAKDVGDAITQAGGQLSEWLKRD